MAGVTVLRVEGNYEEFRDALWLKVDKKAQTEDVAFIPLCPGMASKYDVDVMLLSWWQYEDTNTYWVVVTDPYLIIPAAWLYSAQSTYNVKINAFVLDIDSPAIQVMIPDRLPPYYHIVRYRGFNDRILKGVGIMDEKERIAVMELVLNLDKGVMHNYRDFYYTDEELYEETALYPEDTTKTRLDGIEESVSWCYSRTGGYFAMLNSGRVFTREQILKHMNDFGLFLMMAEGATHDDVKDILTTIVGKESVK